MSDEQLRLPAPEDPGSSQESGGTAAPRTNPSANERQRESAGRRKKAERQRSDRRAKPSYPSEEECLAALGRIPGLVMLGYMSTSKANSIRAAFAEVLRWHASSKRGREESRLEDEGLLSLLRIHPELLSLVEPLLTDEQIDLVTGAAGEWEEDENKGRSDGQT